MKGRGARATLAALCEGATSVDKHWREKNQTVTRVAVWLDRQGHAGRLPRSVADRVCWWLAARYGIRGDDDPLPNNPDRPGA